MKQILACLEASRGYIKQDISPREQVKLFRGLAKPRIFSIINDIVQELDNS